jgi:hypothetical protein
VLLSALLHPQFHQGKFVCVFLLALEPLEDLRYDRAEEARDEREDLKHYRIIQMSAPTNTATMQAMKMSMMS